MGGGVIEESERVIEEAGVSIAERVVKCSQRKQTGLRECE